jgi:hypothetical protein
MATESKDLLPVSRLSISGVIQHSKNGTLFVTAPSQKLSLTPRHFTNLTLYWLQATGNSCIIGHYKNYGTAGCTQNNTIPGLT